MAAPAAGQDREPVGPFWGDLEMGEYDVGFRVMITQDPATLRQLQLSVWYPAVGSPDMTIADYAATLKKQDTSSNRLTPADREAANAALASEMTTKHRWLLRGASGLNRLRPNKRGYWGYGC